MTVPAPSIFFGGFGAAGGRRTGQRERHPAQRPLESRALAVRQIVGKTVRTAVGTRIEVGRSCRPSRIPTAPKRVAPAP